MIRMLGYAGIALGFLLAQTNLLPVLLPHYAKPELLLMFVVYLCIVEPFVRGAMIACSLGFLLDTCGGYYLGLHASIFTGIFIVGRWSVDIFNTESPLLLLIFVFCGSLLQTAGLMFLGALADLDGLFTLLTQRAVFQASVNVIAAYLLILLIATWQRRFAPRLPVPGFEHLLDKPHGT